MQAKLVVRAEHAFNYCISVLPATEVISLHNSCSYYNWSPGLDQELPAWVIKLISTCCVGRCSTYPGWMVVVLECIQCGTVSNIQMEYSLSVWLHSAIRYRDFQHFHPEDFCTLMYYCDIISLMLTVLAGTIFHGFHCTHYVCYCFPDFKKSP